ncbi:MAG: NAD-glutamate dehydrogenase, partial [Mariprofundaceae bacterium]|nr:NAD-glutamate dehydrogenase [Mariprofundaceae bacterium]
MQTLRRQLIDLLTHARSEQRLPMPEPRLAAVLVDDLLALLHEPAGRQTAMRCRSISHNNLYRNVFTIRCHDQAFFLDAIKGYLARCGIQPLEQQAVVFHLDRDERGSPLAILPPDNQGRDHHMFIALHISATTTPDAAPLSRDLEVVLHAVNDSVQDFPAIHAALEEMAGDMVGDAPQDASLLTWLNDNRYICFGLSTQEGADKKTASARHLGAFRNQRVLQHLARGIEDQLPDLQDAKRPGLEWLHLPACQHYLYSVAPVELVRISWRRDKKLHSALLLGHFSRSARHANASQLPRLEESWQSLLQAPLLAESAFYRREIRTLFDRLPKSLLLAIPAREWLAPLKSFADLTGLVHTHSVVFTPPPGSMHIILTSLPVDRFGPNVLKLIGQHLAESGLMLCGHESFGVGSHRIALLACTGPRPGAKKVASAIQESVIFWKDRAKAKILKHAKQLNVPDALERLSRLPPVYQNIFPPEQFIDDLHALDWVARFHRTRVHVRPNSDGIDIQIFTDRPLPLGHIVSIVQSFGLTALREAVVEFGEGESCLYLSNLTCRYPSVISRDGIGRLTLALDHVFNDEAESEGINMLVLAAGLDIQQVAVLATLRNHLVQLLPDAAPLMMTDMLGRHPQAAARLYRMFEARHRPAMPESYITQSRLDFDQAMETVSSLTDDRMFRALADLVEAGLRTNAYAREAADPVSIKIAPQRLEFTPTPVPLREIFVHGVHV